MYVLGRGFSHRRKSASKSPRDLHIRKISLSGCSVGSWDSASSTCSSAATPTMPSFPPVRSDTAITTRSSLENNPLASHPSYLAPPRLAHRPYLQPDHRRAYTSPEVGSAASLGPTFYDDTEDEDDAANALGFGFAENDAETMELPLHEEQPTNMGLPPAASPLDHAAHEREQPQDYFMFQLAQRPPMPRSHWSESTIQTLQSFDDLDDLASGVCTPANEIDLTEIDLPTSTTTSTTTDTTDDDYEEVESPSTVVGVAESVVILPNFSYKRPATVPQRPSVQATVDKVEELSKMGGWKRRGVVFNKDEADGSDDNTSDDDE